MMRMRFVWLRIRNLTEYCALGNDISGTKNPGYFDLLSDF